LLFFFDGITANIYSCMYYFVSHSFIVVQTCQYSIWKHDICPLGGSSLDSVHSDWGIHWIGYGSNVIKSDLGSFLFTSSGFDRLTCASLSNMANNSSFNFSHFTLSLVPSSICYCQSFSKPQLKKAHQTSSIYQTNNDD